MSEELNPPQSPFAKGGEVNPFLYQKEVGRDFSNLLQTAKMLQDIMIVYTHTGIPCQPFDAGGAG